LLELKFFTAGLSDDLTLKRISVERLDRASPLVGSMATSDVPHGSDSADGLLVAVPNNRDRIDTPEWFGQGGSSAVQAMAVRQAGSQNSLEEASLP
jgi:hypothetical protein